MQLRTILTASAMAASLSIGAVSATGQQNEAEEVFTLSRPAAGFTAIDIGNLNGSIRIVGSDEPGVTIEGVKIVRSDGDGDAKEQLKRIEIVAGSSGDALTLRSVHPNDARGVNYSVEYDIRVPRSWRVTADNANGQITVEGMRAPVAATVANGQVRTIDVSSSVTATVDNGQIDGDVAVPSGGNLALTVTNGQIDSRLAFAGTASCTISATNGEVKLALDENASARLKADVGVGHITVHDLSLTDVSITRPNTVGGAYAGTLGAGAATIDVNVELGAVQFRREE